MTTQAAEKKNQFTGHAGAQNVLFALGNGYEFETIKPAIVIDRDNDDLIHQWSCEIEGAFTVLRAMAGNGIGGYSDPAQWSAHQIAQEVRKFGDWLAF